MDLNQILIFVRVVQAGSFSAAARRLGMPKSTVSRKVSELEARIDARLLQRTTRKLGLTDTGRVYYERVSRMIAEMEEAEQAVGRLQTAPRGLLRVTVPLSTGTLGPIVSAYLTEHPEVQVEMLCTDRRVDLVEERFDVALRAGPLADSALIARRLGAVRRVLVASPTYCKRRGIPSTPSELQDHACITFHVGSTPNVWPLTSSNKKVEVLVRPRLAVNDGDIMRDAALAGIGIALMPEPLCADDVRRGRLRHVLPEWSSPEVPLHALFPTARHLSPKVVEFVDLCARHLDTSMRLHEAADSKLPPKAKRPDPV